MQINPRSGSLSLLPGHSHIEGSNKSLVLISLPHSQSFPSYLKVLFIQLLTCLSWGGGEYSMTSANEFSQRNHWSFSVERDGTVPDGEQS